MTATILDNQLGLAEESTYGTRVVPTRFLEFKTEGIARNQTFRQSVGLRKGYKVQRNDRQSAINKGANGTLTMDFAFQGFSMLLKHLLGAAPTITALGGVPIAYQHVFTLGDGAGLSLTTQIGKPTPAGTVQPHDFRGCKLADGTFQQNLDSYLELQLTVDAQQDETSDSLASASYPATQDLLHDDMLTVTVNGTAFDETVASCKIDRNLNLARYFNHSSSLKKEPLWAGPSPITGSLAGEFLDWTTYTEFTGNTIVPIVFTWTGALISGANNESLTISMPQCRLEGPKPVTSKPGILDAATPFSALDGASAPITVTLVTTDSAI